MDANKCKYCDLIESLEEKRAEIIIEYESDNVLAYRAEAFGEMRINIISKTHMSRAINFKVSYEDDALAIEISKVIDSITRKYMDKVYKVEEYKDIMQQFNHALCQVVCR